jgi:hypothetical protein
MGKDTAMTLGVERHDLEGYMNADGATQDHRRAISEYAFLFDGGAISLQARTNQAALRLATEENHTRTKYIDRCRSIRLWPIMLPVFPRYACVARAGVCWKNYGIMHALVFV